MIRAVILCLLATTAHADDQRLWEGSGASSYRDSFARIHEPTAPDAVATVTFANERVHSADEAFDLTFDGLTVHVLFDWQVNDTPSERITVEAPDGYIAIPRYIDVAEGEVGTVQIIEWVGS